MRGGGIRNPLERTLLAGAVLVGFATVLWLLSITVSWATECPQSGTIPTGLDKGISLWPPGADCFAEHQVEGASDRTIVYEATPWLKWVILGFALTAMATLVAGLAASINSLRSRPAGS